MEVKQKAALIYNAIEDKKGSRISVLDISGISVMADYFVIADAENNNQLQAIADNVEEQMMKMAIIAVLKENQNLAGYCLTLAILLFIYSIRKIVYSTILSVFGEMQSQCQRNSLALKRPLYNLQHKKTVSLEKSL